MTLPKERPRPWIRYLALTGLLIMGLMLLFPTVCTIPIRRDRENNQVRNQAAMLRLALRSYDADYGTLPQGDDAQIMKALGGDNPRKTVYFEGQTSRYNARGEYLDRWGVPFRFDLSHPDHPRAYSCGPNTKDEGGADGSDDLVSY